MKRVLAVITAAVVASGLTVRAASARPAEGAVTSLTVAPVAGKAELVIGVNGAVRVSEFTLTSPDRVVIDIENATLGVAPVGYDKVARGGVKDIRYSQFRKSTVRVVIYLDTERAYKVWRSVGRVHVAVTSEPAAQFAVWKLEGNSAPTTSLASGPDRLGDRLTAPKPAPAATQPAPAAAQPAPAAAQTTTAASPATAAPKPAAQTVAAESAPVAARPAPAAEPPARVAENTPAAPARAEPAEDTRPMRTVVQQSSQSQQRSPQPRISVTYQGSDIRDVLAAFAAFSGRTIIPSNAVPASKVDAEIRDQPWDVALQAILASQQLAATEDANGIIIVDTQDRIAARAATEPLVTRVVRLNYQRATAVGDQLRQRVQQCIPSERAGSSSDAAGQPPSGGAPPAQPTVAGYPMPGSSGSGSCVGRGNVSADEVTNSVSITAPASIVDDLVAFGETLDLRQPQVNIKAKIILVNRTDLDALGVKYDLANGNQFFSQIVQGRPLPGGGTSAPTTPPTVLLGGNTVSAIANASGSVPGAALKVIYSTALGNFDFTTFLDALQEVSLLDVQSEPSVTILNNRTAELISGSQVPFVPTAGGSGGGLVGVVNVERVQTGVTLRVTPSVTNNRNIMMRVETINSGATFGPNGVLIDNNSSKSELLVPDGQTVVIGGLTQTTVQLSKSGIPLLVDLPLIGRLFGVTSRTETRRDLLILITPHIIDEGLQSPEAPRR
jgi:type IV pilus assembly protein PilQ